MGGNTTCHPPNLILSFSLVLLIVTYLHTLHQLYRYYTSQSWQSGKLFLQSSESGLPHPLAAGECAPHPMARGGGGVGGRHTRWRERGWESPNSDEGTYTVVLYIFNYFVLYIIVRLPFLKQGDFRAHHGECQSYDKNILRNSKTLGCWFTVI
jgi:hypothetical protein